MSDPYASNLSAAVDVRMKFFPLAFLLLLFKPQLQVDGAPPVAMSWGTARVPLAPGRHQLRAYVPYLFFRTMGDASCVIDIAAGQTMQATWSAPWLAFLPGKWRLEGVQAGAAPIAGAVAAAPPVAATPAATTAASAAWHPDPTGRHQLRYWDGQTWTAHVSDNGVAATDPIA